MGHPVFRKKKIKFYRDFYFFSFVFRIAYNNMYPAFRCIDGKVDKSSYEGYYLFTFIGLVYRKLAEVPGDARGIFSKFEKYRFI